MCKDPGEEMSLGCCRNEEHVSSWKGSPRSEKSPGSGQGVPCRPWQGVWMPLPAHRRAATAFAGSTLTAHDPVTRRPQGTLPSGSTAQKGHFLSFSAGQSPRHEAPCPRMQPRKPQAGGCVSGAITVVLSSVRPTGKLAPLQEGDVESDTLKS